MNPTVTAVIPSIPPRRKSLARAIDSVLKQSHSVDAISVASDTKREGAWVTRHRALMAARTEWVAFLDDDDLWLPRHVGHLLETALDTGADYVYPDFLVVDGNGNDFMSNSPFPHFHEWGPWDNERPHQTTITTLVRTELAQEVGFAHPDEGGEVDGHRFGEDFHFTLNCMRLGGKIVFHDEITWHWTHDGRNTSGLPRNW